MARKFLTSLDLSKNELQNAVVQNLASAPSSPVKGQLYFDTSTTPGILYYYNGSAWISAAGVTSLTVDNSSIENTGSVGDPSIRVKALGVTSGMLSNSISLSKFTTPTADLDIGTHKLTNVVDPTAAQDAATKNYVDTFVNGLAPKDNVRAATTANGTLASAFANGSVIDGVTLATGDRILLKNQTTGAENGIYVVAASGAPTRSVDADSSGDLLGATTFVSEGTVNGNTLWVMTTDGPLTVGTTALVWSQYGGPGAVTGGTGITVTGQSVAITVPVAIINGGTGGITAAAAKTNLGFMTRQAFNSLASTVTACAHNLGTLDVVVDVFEVSTGAQVIADVVLTDVNTVTVTFAVAATAGQYRIVVIG